MKRISLINNYLTALKKLLVLSRGFTADAKQTLRWPKLSVVLVFLLHAVTEASGQESVFSFYKYAINEKEHTFDIYVKALNNGKNETLLPKDVYIQEYIDGVPLPNKMVIAKIRPEVEELKRSTDSLRSLSVLFLLDLGPATPRNAALELLLQTFDSLRAQAPKAYIYLRTIGDVMSEPIQITTANVRAEVESLRNISSNGNELYDRIRQNVQYVNSMDTEKKVLVLITSGVNQTVSGASEPNELSGESGFVLRVLQKTNQSFLLFPIGVGSGASANTAFFRSMVNATDSRLDTFSINRYLPAMSAGLRTKVDLAYNNVMQLYTARPVFRGEKRQIVVRWTKTGQTSQSAVFSLGGLRPDERLLPKTNWWSGLLTPFIVGIGMVIGFYLIFKEAVPFVSNRAFKKQFVIPYKTGEGLVKKRDSYTGDYIKDGELIVTKCRSTCTLATWQYVGNKCPEYPRCLSYPDPCDGAGAPVGNDDFFAGKGIFRRLNWLWFGMLGGFIAWLLLTLFDLVDFNWYRDLLASLLAGLSAQQDVANEALLTRINAWAHDTLFGVALGAGVTFTLAWVEERFQPRKPSWRRIIARTIIGIIISFAVFFGGFYLQTIGLADSPAIRFLLSLVVWLLFGLSMGFVLSLESSISLGRAMLSGVLASVISFLAYLGMAELGGGFALADLLGFIVLGSILGFTIVSVVATLEDFELEYLQPEVFRSTNPISKWLKAGIDIFVGKEPGSYVYVKWEDPDIAPRHARLTLNQGSVYIQPYADVLVNGRLIPLRELTPLRNGDLIKFGRNSVTIMRFIEKRKQE